MRSIAPSFSAVLLASALFGFIGASARADIILEQYEFQGQTGSETSLAPSLTTSGLTGMAFGEGAGLTPLATVNSINSTGWTNANAYYTFGFTVAAGQVASVDQIILGTKSSGTGPGVLNVQVSVDGGALQSVGTITEPGTNYNDQMLSITPLNALHSLQFYITASGTTSASGGTTGSGGTFRVVDYAPSGSTTNTPFTLNGTLAPAAPAAVPEPAAWILTPLGLGLAGLIARGRRRAV